MIFKNNNWISRKMIYRNTQISKYLKGKTFWDSQFNKIKIIIQFNKIYKVNNQMLTNIKGKNHQLNLIMEVREIWMVKCKGNKKLIWNKHKIYKDSRRKIKA